MAADVDYGYTDSDLGVYAIYDDFYVRIFRTGAITYKLRYRIKVTVNTIVFPTVDVVTNSSNVAIVNPVAFLRDSYFASENNMDLQFPTLLDKGLNIVQIEIGEVAATAADLPPTFLGYDTDDSFYFFNGFTTSKNTVFGGYENYRLPELYDTTPLKLAVTNLNPKILITDINYLTYYGAIPFDDGVNTGVIEPQTLEVTYIDEDGATISTDSIAATSFSDVGIWYLDISPSGTLTYPSNWDSVDMYITYSNTPAEPAIAEDSEVITIHKQCANPKSDRIRLRWFNRLGGLDYFNFTLKNEQRITVAKGKTILTDGVDREAASFGSIKNNANPERFTFGDSKENFFTANTDWLNEEEIDSLEGLLTAPKVIMRDIDNNIIPVLIESREYTKPDLRNGLKQLSIRFKLANQPKVVKQ